MDSGERNRRQVADAWAWLRERKAAKRETEPDWRTEPEIWSIWKARQLQAALPEHLRDLVTIAAGVMRMPDGAMVPLISRNGWQHWMNEAVYALRGDAEVAHDGYDSNGRLIRERASVHAEVRMLEHAERVGATLVAVAAGRPVCEPCVNRLDAADVPIGSRLKEPYQDRPNQRRDQTAPSIRSDPDAERQAWVRDDSRRPHRPAPPPPRPHRPPPNQPPPNQPGRGGRRGPRQ